MRWFSSVERQNPLLAIADRLRHNNTKHSGTFSLAYGTARQRRTIQCCRFQSSDRLNCDRQHPKIGDGIKKIRRRKCGFLMGYIMLISWTERVLRRIKITCQCIYDVSKHKTRILWSSRRELQIMPCLNLPS